MIGVSTKVTTFHYVSHLSNLKLIILADQNDGESAGLGIYQLRSDKDLLCICTLPFHFSVFVFSSLIGGIRPSSWICILTHSFDIYLSSSSLRVLLDRQLLTGLLVQLINHLELTLMGRVQFMERMMLHGLRLWFYQQAGPSLADIVLQDNTGIVGESRHLPILLKSELLFALWTAY